MDLQVITPMLTLSNQPIKVLHLESTNACNAACPQCPREIELNFDKNLPPAHLSVDQIKKIVSVDFIRGLEKMFICGNYGDPAAGKHTLEIFKYFRSINPDIVLGMNTNGSLRNSNWWSKLSKILNQPRDYVVWSIDGLADTNHIYRINTKWTNIMKNAQAFIQAGGVAHWDMLVFKHNEHQVDQVEKLAKELGFAWFRTKVSKRFEYIPVSFLSLPTSSTTSTTTSSAIRCHALNESSIYISAKAEIFPCCWLGVYPNATMDKFSDIRLSWASNTPLSVCKTNCTEIGTGTKFSNQWKREIEF